MGQLNTAFKDLSTAVTSSAKALPKEGGIKPLQAFLKGVFDVIFFVPKLIGQAFGLVAKGSAVASVAGAKATGKGLLYVAKQPLVGVVKLATGAVKVVKGHPIATAVTAAGAAAISLGMSARAGAEEQTQKDLINQIRGPQPSYMNTVSPQEAAAMDARMKQGGQASFAEAQAARAAEANASAAPTAAV